MSFLRFWVSKRGFNQVLNGFRYYIDMSDDTDCSDVERAFRDIQQYAILKKDDFDHDTGEVYGVNVSCGSRTMNLIWTLSDWFGEAAEDDEYCVDYAAPLVERYKEYWDAYQKRVAEVAAEKQRRKEEGEKKAAEKKAQVEKIRADWVCWCEDNTKVHTKKAFADSYGYSYNVVLNVLR